MGSRTGSTYRSLAGTNRSKKLKNLGDSISNELKVAETSVVSNSEAGGGNYSGGATSGSLAPFLAPISTSAAIAISSVPILDILYHTTKSFNDVVDNLETKNFNISAEETYSLFTKNSFELPTNVAQSIVVDNISDLAWDNIKTEMNLSTTPSQDRLAKFILSQSIGIAIDMIKEKLKGKKIDKHFFYKKAIGIGLEYTLDSFFQSASENEILDNNPSVVYNQMDSAVQKVCETTLKEISKELADQIYDDIKENAFPQKIRFQNIIKQKISEKLNVKELKNKFKSDKKYDKRNILVSDRKEVPKELTEGKLILSTETKVNDKEINQLFRIKLKPNEDDYLLKSIESKHKDLLNIASTLSKLEFLLRNETSKTKNIIKKNIIPLQTNIISNTKVNDEAKSLINTLSSFLLGIKSNLDFIHIDENENEIEENEKKKSDVIVLFSGGLDSVSAIDFIKYKTKYKNPKFVFINNGSPKISTIVRRFANELKFNDDLVIFQSHSGGYFLQQTRGFLFLTAAAITADIYGAKDIIVAECGVTKYQPSISLSDEITKTTHPFMIKLAKEIFSNFDLNVNIKFPFDDNTKAEIIASHSNINTLIKTHSCRYSMFSDFDKKECGYCFACIMKNISLSYVTGKIQTQFMLDPITKPIDYVGNNLKKKRVFKYKNYESILSLIGFSKSILSNNIKKPNLEYMEQYNKIDLFKRNSEDMIYGLIFMKKKGWVKNKVILDYLEKIEKEEWFNPDRVEERRKEILKLKNEKEN